jgi:uncharacterized metal-binding protein
MEGNMSEQSRIPTLNIIGNTCCGEEAKTLVYACSGSSNVGQTANNIMVELNKNGYASAGCLAGIGAGLSGFVESAKGGRSIVIDGCLTACGKKIFEAHSIEPYKHFVVTELGIKKTYDFSQLDKETKAAMDWVVPNI